MHMDHPSEARSTPQRPVVWALTALATVGSALLRIAQFPPNVMPVGALALYSGGKLRWWQAWLPPLAAMAASNWFLWHYSSLNPDLWVYASFLVYVLLGRLLTGSDSALRIGSVAALGSLQFFLITNFGTWYASLATPQPMYPPTAAGLLECYAAGLAFLGYTLLGDLGFAAVLFGAHAWLTRPAARPAVEDVRA